MVNSSPVGKLQRSAESSSASDIVTECFKSGKKEEFFGPATLPNRFKLPPLKCEDFLVSQQKYMHHRCQGVQNVPRTLTIIFTLDIT